MNLFLRQVVCTVLYIFTLHINIIISTHAFTDIFLNCITISSTKATEIITVYSNLSCYSRLPSLDDIYRMKKELREHNWPEN